MTQASTVQPQTPTTLTTSPPRFTSPMARKKSTAKFDRNEIIKNHVPTTDIIDKLKKNKSSFIMLDVTWEEALDLLTLNDIGQNRHYNEKQIAKYTLDMKRNRWKDVGDPIRFDKNWKLIDGQHRLWAQWEARVTLPHSFRLHLEPDAFSSIDIGSNRTAGDIISIAGYKARSVSLGYAVKNILLFKTHKKLAASISSSLISNQLVAEFARNKKKMGDLSNHIGKAEKELTKQCNFFSKPQWAALIYILNDLPWSSDQTRNQKISVFINKLAKGNDLSENDPIFKLRKILENFEAQILQKKTAKLANNVFLSKAKFFFFAWNKYITGEKGNDDLKPDFNNEEIEMPRTAKYN